MRGKCYYSTAAIMSHGTIKPPYSPFGFCLLFAQLAVTAGKYRFDKAH